MFDLSLEKIKRNKWNTAVIVVALGLLLTGTLHSIQFNVHGALINAVFSLMILVVLMNIINTILIPVHLLREKLDRALVTFIIIIISSLIWILTMIIDPIGYIV